ncbi:ABC-type phosphate transport system substrate-binding protein [Amycolatopsis bartoniae]|uniref:hypothetical protein n=1 Tax=Amycolatopsis bartoniae TaxID=941986 RepID=UPI001848A483|nr:hypothetical protein [Amycolatopsis bartoniae]MBB2934314.1 ABC-type phosphate transport system substrate-binding protein [Amycolatopsis bartoniae]
MSVRRAVVAVALGVFALCCAGCHEQASAPAPQPQDELSRIQTTLDAIDSELAGDGSP